MSIQRSDTSRIDRIRLAGFTNVIAKAKAAGVAPWRIQRDISIIKAIAVSSINQAAQSTGVHPTTAEKVLKKYEGYALEILRSKPKSGQEGV